MSSHCDCIIIGGGPSGLMAAISASRHQAKVILIDKGDHLGRKLGISGGGRCNVTNAAETDELIRHIPGNGRFLYSALSTFSNYDIMQFFESLGIQLKEEDNGRMFPVSDKAKTVVEALIGEVRRGGVDIRVNQAVDCVLYENGQTVGVRLRNGQTVWAPQVIIATGGKSVPQTGSTGDGYAWAIDAGHTITDLYPTEVPLVSGDSFIQSKELQGLSLRGIEAAVWSPQGKRLIAHHGDMIFTHFGISGPAILRCSQFVVKALKKYGQPTVLLTLDLRPQDSKSDLIERIIGQAKANPKRHLKTILKDELPERIVPIILRRTELAEDLTFDQLPRLGVERLAESIKGFRMQIRGTLPIEQAFVTGGGVNLKEIDPKTMASKLMPGLHFCGEILDIHGYTGGYNITAAFTTGYCAGRNAALSQQSATSGTS